MKASTLPTLLTALGRAESSGSPDAMLLKLFTTDNDQGAFTQLVHRYARLVWRVARTRCRTEATAEDVFQATFVVLAKKAGSIRAAGALAGWLHRTAHRLAVKATRAENKAKPDRAVPVQSNPLDDLSARELLATVDDELAKLTDAERSVLILCGVDGDPLDDVATRLGCSATVVKGRLQRARAKLRSRLESRGLTLPAVLVGLFAAPSLSTIQAAISAATSTTYSLAVSTLIAEVITMKAMALKATLTLALCGMIAIVGGGSGGSPNPSPNAIASPLPKSLKNLVSAWGDERDGLQAELRMPSGTTVEPGQVAEMQVVVRNNSKKAITFEYTDQVLGVYVGGESVDGKVELHWSVYINGIMPKAQVKTLEPGEEFIRWKLQVRHTPKADAEPHGVSHVDLPAGVYKFVMKQVGGDFTTFPKKKSTLDQLGTGSLEVNLLEPTRRNISAPLPKEKFEWKEGKGIQFKPSPYGDRITGLAHSPDGKYIAVAVGEQVHLLDATTQKPVNEHALTAKAPGTITSVVFSPKGDKLAMTAKDFVFLYCELGKSPSVSSDNSWKTPGFDPHQVVWLQSEDGKERLIATNGEESRFRDPDGKEQIYPWLPDCRHRASILAAVPGKDAWLMSNDNGKKLPEHTFWYWSADAEKGRRLLVGHKARPTSAVVSADGKRIVSADEGGTLIVWEGEMAEFKEKSRIELGEGVAQLALASDGKTLAVIRAFPSRAILAGAFGARTDVELHVYDIDHLPKDFKAIWTTGDHPLSGKPTRLFSLAFSPDGKKLLAAFADPYIIDKDAKSMGIKVWELVPGK